MATVRQSVNCWQPPYSGDQVTTFALRLEMERFGFSVENVVTKANELNCKTV